jgi:hypothetical protein
VDFVCDTCCKKEHKKHALLDIHSQLLIMFFGNTSIHIKLDEKVKHRAQIGYTIQVLDVYTVNGLEGNHIRSLHLGLTLSYYVMVGPDWSGPDDLVAQSDYAIGTIKCSQDNNSCQYTKNTTLGLIMRTIHSANSRFHHTRNALTLLDEKNTIQSMAIVTQTQQAREDDVLDIIIHISCVNVVESMSTVLVHVQLNGIYIQNASILTSFISENEYLLTNIWYSLYPDKSQETTNNLLYVNGGLNFLMQSTRNTMVHSYNLTCLGCSGNYEIFDKQTQSCQCEPGTALVCTQCASNLCDSHKFLVTTVPDTCIVGKFQPQGTGTSIYSVQCLPCSGTFYCPTGNNTDIKRCPVRKPYAVNDFAKSVTDCVCADNTTTPHSNIQKHENMVFIQNPIVTSQCDICKNNEICNPTYKQNAVRECPYLTEQVHSKKKVGYTHITTKTCKCIPGFYTDNIQLITDERTDERTNQFDANNHAWSINIQDAKVTVEISFEDETHHQNQTNITTNITAYIDMIINHTFSDNMTRIMKDWVESSCYGTTCVSDKPIISDISLICESAVFCSTRSYTIIVQVVLNYQFDYHSLSSELLSNSISDMFDQFSLVGYSQVDENIISYMPNVTDLSIQHSIVVHNTSNNVPSDLFWARYYYNVKLHTCLQCPIGFFCDGYGQKEICPSNSVSLLMSTNVSSCTCLPGYTGNCMICPENYICYGAGINSYCKSEDSIDFNCPCSTDSDGQFRNKTTGICEKCPVNFFCPVVRNTTGLNPFRIQIPIRCPVNSFSMYGSTQIENCVCGEGIQIPKP